MVVFSDAYYRDLRTLMGSARSKSDLFQTIVNTPFQDQLTAVRLGLGAVVLLLANDHTNTLNHIALSDTEAARGAIRMTAKPFDDIKIPLNNQANILITAMNEQRPQQTTDWQWLFVPELTAQEARINQAGAGVEVSAVYPLKKACHGTLIFSYYERPQALGSEHHTFMESYTALTSEALLAALPNMP